MDDLVNTAIKMRSTTTAGSTSETANTSMKSERKGMYTGIAIRVFISHRTRNLKTRSCTLLREWKKLITWIDILISVMASMNGTGRTVIRKETGHRLIF